MTSCCNYQRLETWGWGCSGGECLPGKHKTLSSIPSTSWGETSLYSSYYKPAPRSKGKHTWNKWKNTLQIKIFLNSIKTLRNAKYHSKFTKCAQWQNGDYQGRSDWEISQQKGQIYVTKGIEKNEQKQPVSVQTHRAWKLSLSSFQHEKQTSWKSICLGFIRKQATEQTITLKPRQTNLERQSRSVYLDQKPLEPWNGKNSGQ
jgi:hypothetical protein